MYMRIEITTKTKNNGIGNLIMHSFQSTLRWMTWQSRRAVTWRSHTPTWDSFILNMNSTNLEILQRPQFSESITGTLLNNFKHWLRNAFATGHIMFKNYQVLFLLVAWLLDIFVGK